MRKLILLLLPTLLLACGSEQRDQTTTNEDSTATEEKMYDEMDHVTHSEDEYGMTHEQYEELMAQSREPKLGKMENGEWQVGEDELDYVLTLKQISDGAYPSYSVEALPEKQEETVWFYLNAEAYKGTDINTLIGSINKPARIVYWIRPMNHMVGVEVNGEKKRDIELEGRDGVKTIKGKWIAESVSGGDLPDDIYIETANDLRVAFPAYITEDDVAMNGKEVTVHYVTDEDMVISYIKVL